LRIAAAHGAYNIRVFGSVADGRARPDSDIDFIVEMEPDRTVLDLADLIRELREALGREIDVVELADRASTTQRALRDAVPL
jgi:predicted nucleotidyltransferase